MKLLVLDGNSLVNRAYFGIKLLTTKDGRYTNAIFGFQNILLNLLSAHHPDAVAIAWDEKAPTFRHTAYDGYKATRHGMPQELAEQMPVLKQLLTDLGFVQVSKPGWEADDILGTLAAANEAAGGTTLLATGDRDSLQLVDDATTVLLATNRETLPMDPAAIQEKYGVAPPQLIEVKSLMGDASDNIPGVPGIGEKTALALVQKFGSLQGVYEHLDDKAIKPKQREKLEANKELAELSHMLGTIRKDAPIETAPEHYCRTAGDPAAAAQLLAELEMHKLTARWGLDESPAAVAASAETLPEVQPDLLPLAPEGRYDLAQNKDGSWYAVQGDSVYLLDNDRLPSLLDAAGVQLRVFDAKPLYHIALEHGGVGAAIVFDGKLAAYLLNPSASDYQAGQLAAEYAAAPAFACAAAPDAGALSALLDVLSTKLDEQGGHDLLATMELPLARVLADMERIGFAVDAEGIRQFGDSLRAELNGILQNIYAEVGYEFNLNSPKQLGEALFDKLGLPPRKKTARGYSTDAETLESLREYPLVEDVLQYRAYQKLNSTYVEGLLKVIGEDGRIHTRFNQTEARTGRLSSDNPNLQNIPIRTDEGRRVREAFVAPAGSCIVSADYSQIELRIMAHLSGDTGLTGAFARGEDVHRATAGEIFGVTPLEVTSEQRRYAKVINFGLIYGMSAHGLAKNLGIERAAAANYIDRYFARYPGVAAYMERTRLEAKLQGYVETVFGRRLHLPDIRAQQVGRRQAAERAAINAPMQGTAADLIKKAMIAVSAWLKASGVKSRLILQVHDELVLEVPDAEVALIREQLPRLMADVAQLSVPLLAEVGVGANWDEAH